MIATMMAAMIMLAILRMSMLNTMRISSDHHRRRRPWRTQGKT